MKCNKCNRENLTLSDFVFKNKQKGILHSICKECQKVYKLKYYYANKQEHYNRNEKTSQKLIQFVKNYKETHPCAHCGESDIACLDFHHLKDKKDCVSALVQKGSLKKIKRRNGKMYYFML